MKSVKEMTTACHL